MVAMLDLFLLFVPFFALVLMGWAATRGRLVPIDGIGTMNSFVLFFGLSAMVFRLSASGALMQNGLLGLLLAYGLAGTVVTGLALMWGVRSGLIRRDSGLVALASAFPNTGFLGLPLLTGLLGPEAAGPIAATLIVDVLVLSSLCLAWAHPGQVSIKGALRNPLLWAMGLGMGLWWSGWHLPHAVDETVRLLSLSATPTALFTLGAILARSQMQPSMQAQVSTQQGAAAPAVWTPVLLKLVLHPWLVCGAGWVLVQSGAALPPAGLLAMILAAALPSASNVSMLAEREGANTALVARIILWTTASALLTVTLWAHAMGVQPK